VAVPSLQARGIFIFSCPNPANLRKSRVFRRWHLPRKNLWGGRFGSAQDPFFAEFNDSLSFDKELLEADIEGSLAYARALERAGIFSRNERRSVEKGLQAILDDNRRAPQTVALSHAEDVHSYVEEALKAKVGDLALKLHTGRSRNDQVATDFCLWVREAVDRLEQNLTGLQSALLERAERDMGIILPGYTHFQRAQPVLAPHYWLAYCEKFQRDRLRLADGTEGGADRKRQLTHGGLKNRVVRFHFL